MKYYGLLRYSSSLLRDVFDFEVFVVVFGETGFGSGLEVMGWVMGLYFLEGIVVEGGGGGGTLLVGVEGMGFVFGGWGFEFGEQEASFTID